jgi:hypothetical protein
MTQQQHAAAAGWVRVWRAPITAVVFAYLLMIAVSLEWVYLEHPDLLNQAPRALVYRASFAGAAGVVLGLATAKIYFRMRRLERIVEQLVEDRRR